MYEADQENSGISSASVQECLHLYAVDNCVNRECRKFTAKQIMFTVTQRPCKSMLIMAQLHSTIKSLNCGKSQVKCCNNDITHEHTQRLYYTSFGNDNTLCMHTYLHTVWTDSHNIWNIINMMSVYYARIFLSLNRILKKFWTELLLITCGGCTTTGCSHTLTPHLYFILSLWALILQPHHPT
jgi:hypothetical protein